ncbi:unnamed protein product [Rotaria socialis]|uniref:EF-hand domain-containing protein n=1 Tax=Rotaria socialis TaxID=392032 RepID=A0A821AAM1_9BILA|nr:unnamed protein product [Rotaria socialis]
MAYSRTDFLEKYPSGVLDNETFIEYCQMLHLNTEMQNFNMIDANKDELIDFNELLIAIVLASRLQDVEARLGIVFDTWDLSCDGKINQAELVHVITAIYDCSGVTN